LPEEPVDVDVAEAPRPLTECCEALTLSETPLWGTEGERPIALLGAYTPALVVALNGGWAKIETEDGRQGYVETWQLAALE
jgi:hypothetical protein